MCAQILTLSHWVCSVDTIVIMSNTLDCKIFFLTFGRHKVPCKYKVYQFDALLRAWANKIDVAKSHEIST